MGRAGSMGQQGAGKNRKALSRIVQLAFVLSLFAVSLFLLSSFTATPNRLITAILPGLKLPG